MHGQVDHDEEALDEGEVMRRILPMAALLAVALLAAGCSAGTPGSAPAPAPTSDRPAAVSTLDGTYRRIHATPVCPGFSPTAGEDQRLDELVIAGSQFTFYYYADHDDRNPIGDRFFDWTDRAEILREKIMLTHDAQADVTMTYALAGDELRFSDAKGDCITAWILATDPSKSPDAWTKVR